MTEFPQSELPVLSVSQVTHAIKLLLETRFPQILVQGEISNFKRQSSGHLYFSIKDAQSQISAVMFRSAAIGLNPLPKEGDQVIVKGQIGVYEPRGSYQIIVRELYYVGIGAILLQLEQLKQKLRALGWFDPERKKPLPRFPTRIAVVTSPTGAVIQDILNVLQRRHAGVHLLLNPVKVQGEGAAEEIAAAIAQVNQYQLGDVLIVGRGGGSIEDLLAFSDERVAKAIFESRIPVISAVGHESDNTIADLVADRRAPTPSAAAEIVTGERQAQIAYLQEAKVRVANTVKHLVQQTHYQIARWEKHPLIASPTALLSRFWQQIDEMKEALESSFEKSIAKKRLRLTAIQNRLEGQKPTAQLPLMRQRLGQLDRALEAAMEHFLNQKLSALPALVAHLYAIDPRSLLKRGYSILFSEKGGSLIISTHQLQVQQEIRAYLSDGSARLLVQEVAKECPTPQ